MTIREAGILVVSLFIAASYHYLYFHYCHYRLSAIIVISLKVTAPVQGRAFGDMFLQMQHGGGAKVKRAFCMGEDEELSQASKASEAH